MARKPKSKPNLLADVPLLWRERFETLGRIVRGDWPLCVVGGCVRDLILKRPPLDWDVVSEGPVALLAKEAAEKLSARLIQHPAFLTYTLTFTDGTSLDIATARKETYPEPASLPVVEPSTLDDDFRRRDFTVNAMSAHLTSDRWGQKVDPFHGTEDLGEKLIRSLHDKSFEDDPTRIYRAARYAGRLGCTVETRTEEQILASIHDGYPGRLSPARLRHELERILLEKDPRTALSLLWKWGAWAFLKIGPAWGPSLEAALGQPVAGSDEDRLLMRLMTLCRFQPGTEGTEWLRKLEFPGATIDLVTQTLKLLGRLEDGRMDFSQTTHLSAPAIGFLQSAVKDSAHVKRYLESEPLLKGDDLRELGYAPGPRYQEIFQSLREARWKGVLRSRADEIRHVVDNFPRKK